MRELDPIRLPGGHVEPVDHEVARRCRGECASICTLGAATVLLRYGGLTLLTDPCFVRRGEEVALDVGVRTKRLLDPVVDLAELPPIDVVLVSHLHEDHFDRRTRERLARDLPIVAPAGAERELRADGFREVRGVEPWGSVTIEKGGTRARISALPVHHVHDRLLDKVLPKGMGVILDLSTERTSTRIWISGDTLLFDDLREAPKRFPDVDLALLHVGGEVIHGHLASPDEQQALGLHVLFDPHQTIPIHGDDFDAYHYPTARFAQAMREGDLGDRVIVPERGEVVVLEARLRPVFEPVHRVAPWSVEPADSTRASLASIP